MTRGKRTPLGRLHSAHDLQQAANILGRAAVLIHNPSSYVQGRAAVTSTGRPADPLETAAARWSMAGALRVAQDAHPSIAAVDALQRVRKTAAYREGRVTHADAMRVLREARALCLAELEACDASAT